MWRLDLAFADVVSSTTDPMLGAIRLAWWRERLEELDETDRAPAEPRLEAVARELPPRGITGAELSRLADAWLPLLDPFPWGEAAAQGLGARGRLLFGIGARLLGGDAAKAEAVGALWALVDGAQHCSDVSSREMLDREARRILALPRRMPSRLRPLTIVAAVAAADRESGGNPRARLAAALRHRWFGTFPRG